MAAFRAYFSDCERWGGRCLNVAPNNHAKALFELIPGEPITGDRVTDRRRLLLDTEGRQQVREQLVELRRDKLILATRLLALEPQDPVPKVIVDRTEGLGCRCPRRLLDVRLVRED